MTNVDISTVDVAQLAHVDTTMIFGKEIAGQESYLYDTMNPELTNLELERRDARIHDVRPLRDQLSYSRNGFELADHVSSSCIRANDPRVQEDDFLEALKNDYLEEMNAFIRAFSGSPHVFAQPIGFFVRHGSKSEVRTSQRPAALPHIDFTRESALRMAKLMHETNAPGQNFSSFAIYQTWRAVSPTPHDNTLCFCDGRLDVEKDKRLVESVMGPRDQPGTVYLMDMVLFNPEQQWMYFSDLQPSEVLVFQGYDMRSPNPILHSSFNTGLPGAKPRVSLESRHYAFFE